MASAEHVPLSEVKDRLSEFVDGIERAHGRVIVTRHGHPAVVIMSIEDLESLEETLETLSDSALVKEIREARREVVRGKGKRLSKEEALKLANSG